MSGNAYDPGRIMREVFQLARYWEGILDAGLRDAGITAKQLFLLSLLERQFEGSSPASAIAEAMLTSHQNIMQMARALERRGFVTIAPDPEDRRARLIALTEAHAAFWSARGEEDRHALDAIFDGIPAETWQTFQHLLEAIVPHAAQRYRERRGVTSPPAHAP
jgi:DNA-binding MarR family transcriptional regulator